MTIEQEYEKMTNEEIVEKLRNWKKYRVEGLKCILVEVQKRKLYKNDEMMNTYDKIKFNLERYLNLSDDGIVKEIENYNELDDDNKSLLKESFFYRDISKKREIRNNINKIISKSENKRINYDKNIGLILFFDFWICLIFLITAYYNNYTTYYEIANKIMMPVFYIYVSFPIVIPIFQVVMKKRKTIKANIIYILSVLVFPIIFWVISYFVEISRDFNGNVDTSSNFAFFIANIYRIMGTAITSIICIFISKIKKENIYKNN